MENTEKIFGADSYVLHSKLVDLYIRKTGGQLIADFQIGQRKNERANPFYVAPWWNERHEGLSNNDELLRGDWFAFPFGVSTTIDGIKYPVHGYSVENDYRLTGTTSENGKHCMTMETELKEDKAWLRKEYTLKDDEPVIYLSDTVCGAMGRYPVGYHPTMKVPETLGSAILDTSPYLECWTSTVHIESPAAGGYSSLLPAYKIEDPHRVPTVYGGVVNLRKQPFIKGFDDIHMYISDPSCPFSFTSLTIPSEGYLYFNLKNPRSLGSLMVWTSYGGRHYPPWNGRVNGCIGLEQITGYFYYGRASLYESNHLSDKGFKMYEEFDGGNREYRLIHGLVPIDKDFTGVMDIVKEDEKHIRIIGRNGKSFPVACCVDFLNQEK